MKYLLLLFSLTGLAAGQIDVPDNRFVPPPQAGFLRLVNDKGVLWTMDPNGVRTQTGGVVTSTTGGADKVIKLDGNGNLNLTGSPLSGMAATWSNSIFMADGSAGQPRMTWLNANGSVGGSIYWNEQHSGTSELQINGGRIALCLSTYGGLQLGINAPGSQQFAYFQSRGNATGGTQQTNSLPLYFTGNYWNGGGPVALYSSIQQVVSDNTGASKLVFANNSTLPNEAGGDGTRTPAFAIGANGPEVASGKVLTFADGTTQSTADKATLYSEKVANITFTQSSVTPQDSGLTVNLLANKTYRVEWRTGWTFDSTHGCRVKLAYSGAMTSRMGQTTMTSGGNVTNTNDISHASGLDAFNADMVRTAVSSTQIAGDVTYATTTAGTLKIQGAQAVAGATNTVMLNGSYLMATPLN